MHDEWPRHYIPAELEAIAQSIDREKLKPLAKGKLQEAVEAFQWASATDRDAFVEHGPKQRSANKRRREQLKNIISLCEHGEADEVEIALDELDGRTFQLLGGALNRNDFPSIKSAAERALQDIPTSGGDPQRARQQFIMDLGCIFYLVTRERPGRHVDTYRGEERGLFRDFVRAALEPFGAANECDADIKIALQRLNHARTSQPRK